MAYIGGYNRGSRSVEFSGQITRSGAGLVPDRTAGQRSWRPRGSRHGGGADQIGQAPRVRDVALDRGDGGRAAREWPGRPEAGRPPGRPAAPGDGQRGQRTAAQPGPPPGASSSQATHAPASATTNVSSGAPPTVAHGAAGVPGWLIASLPQGNAYGHRSRSASAPTHQPATASGQARSEQHPLAHGEQREDHRLGDRQRQPGVPGHVDQPGQQRDEERQAEQQAGRSEARRLRRHSATTSSAGPRGRSGHIPTGGNAAVRASPPASAASAQGQARLAGRPGPRGPVPGGRTWRTAGPVRGPGAGAGRVAAPGSPAAGAAGSGSCSLRLPARDRAGRGCRAGAPGRRARSRPPARAAGHRHRPSRRRPALPVGTSAAARVTGQPAPAAPVQTGPALPPPAANRPPRDCRGAVAAA